MDDSDFRLALSLQNQFNRELESPKSKENIRDYELALKLQEQFEQEVSVENPKGNLVYDGKAKKKLDSSKSLIDPSWEVIDPTPDIHILFIAFDERFFWKKLEAVCVAWSKRMTTCAGVCSYGGRGTMCRITLSEPLLKLRPRKDLVETLLHEMIHAYLFVTDNNRDHDGHGPEFHKHMYRINSESGTNITVYHDFHDEVRLYQQHWWRCDGPCQNWKPFFGTVRRATNRAPSPNDRWWGKHARLCGGNFIKVKEPEPKKPKKGKENKAVTTTDPRNDIRNFLPVVKSNDQSTSTSTNQNGSLTDLSINKAATTLDQFNSTSNIHDFSDLNKVSQGVYNKTKPYKKISSSTSIATTSAIGSEFLPKPIDSKAIVRSKSVQEVSSEEFVAVRNRWANKFLETTSDIPSAHTKKRYHDDNSDGLVKSPKVVKILDDDDIDVHCPLCNELVSSLKINEHLDNCLLEGEGKLNTVDNGDVSDKKNSNIQCPSCSKYYKIDEIEGHTSFCNGVRHDSSIIDLSTDEVFLSPDEKIALTQRPDRVKQIEKSPTFCTGDNNLLDDDVFSGWNDLKCPSCTQMIDIDEYNEHSKVCSTNNTNQNKTESPLIAEVVKCLACGKETPKSSLKEHLEECLTDVFGKTSDFDDNWDDKNLNGGKVVGNKYNCPICMKLFLEIEMNTHLDECILK